MKTIFASLLLSLSLTTHAQTTDSDSEAVLKVEDRGNVIVYTSTTQEDISADETCTTITKTVVEKATQKVLSTDSEEFCTRWPL